MMVDETVEHYRESRTIAREAESSPRWNEFSQASVWEHRMIAEALARRDGELARNLLRKYRAESLKELNTA